MEDEQVDGGATAADTGEAFEEPAYGTEADDVSLAEGVESGEGSEAAGAETAGAEDDAPIDWKARAEAAEAKYKEVEDIAPYAPVARNFIKLGSPEEVQSLLAQQEQAAYQAAIDQEEHKGRSIAQQFFANIATQTGEDPEVLAPFQESLGEFLAPLMKELAEMRPIRDQWMAQNQTSQLDKAVAALQAEFPNMDAMSVRREYQAGRNGRDEAVRTHHDRANLMKATAQNAAIDNIKAGTTTGKAAPRVPSARGGLPTGGKTAIPNPITDEAGYEAYLLRNGLKP